MFERCGLFRITEILVFTVPTFRRLLLSVWFEISAVCFYMSEVAQSKKW
jgi:hypothetical protein